jgi:hypothetical protein
MIGRIGGMIRSVEWVLPGEDATARAAHESQGGKRRGYEGLCRPAARERYFVWNGGG